MIDEYKKINKSNEKEKRIRKDKKKSNRIKKRQLLIHEFRKKRTKEVENGVIKREQIKCDNP